MALRTFLILSRPRRGRVEGRSAPIQRLYDWITASKAGVERLPRPPGPAFGRPEDRLRPGASDGTSTLDSRWRGNDDISV